MIDRACISINNHCNLNCTYCHFHTPAKKQYLTGADMDIFRILDHIKRHIDKHDIRIFKLGFVGNGEPLLDYDALKAYLEHISDYLETGRIAAYTITNGTLITEEMLEFFKAHKVNIGFSIDGLPEIHDQLRCNTHVAVMSAIEMYHSMNGCYPPMNCTVGRAVLERSEETIAFFEPFGSRITFSRMIGEDGITLNDYHAFLHRAMQKLNVRTGGHDCTMYGGKCGAGINNIFYANGQIFLCGNCVDLPAIADADTPIDAIRPIMPKFDRNTCYHDLQRS
ncbi:MAG: radical SAM protein [Oscillospiraceae bacterium]|nr:radical SAM protein [Oscillospiraceae bacterium]